MGGHGFGGYGGYGGMGGYGMMGSYGMGGMYGSLCIFRAYFRSLCLICYFLEIVKFFELLF